jgi:glycosyltransferase involved in cell wall biosynthesis
LEVILPSIRVIIPTYNRAHLLKNALKSFISQTFSDIQVFIIDGGSIGQA